ncbi:hypothetical protein QYM36_014434 [Artemia franciscana]|uniref:Uncharacterized protein n=1 Tax=Artemia franciscana TaxID=6661 RepID=A0AA88HNJ2_ARTSF|nr:hypothetical protein QYM36_014434 [Artemia franciscana]
MQKLTVIKTCQPMMGYLGVLLPECLYLGPGRDEEKKTHVVGSSALEPTMTTVVRGTPLESSSNLQFSIICGELREFTNNAHINCRWRVPVTSTSQL